MDIVTQALLGGVLAQSVASRHEKNPATFAGMLAGLLADADILIGSSSDPLLNIEYHRHFTHSLFFIPFGAAIALLLLWPLLRKHISARRLYVFCLAGYSMSGVLDACTSYGTHLFWPFSDERVAFNIISIIDPVFSLILLTALSLGLRLKSRRVAHAGLALCLVYLGFGFMQLQRAQGIAQELLHSRGHSAVQHVVKPTLANLVLWRSVYIHDGHIYVDAVRTGLLDADAVYEGESVTRFAVQRDLPHLDTTSVLYEDILRFSNFSDDFVAFDPGQENVLGDIRYSMSPVSAKPLWGIVIDPAQAEAHADYRFFRERDAQLQRMFVNMVLGRCATTDECRNT